MNRKQTIDYDKTYEKQFILGHRAERPFNTGYCNQCKN